MKITALMLLLIPFLSNAQQGNYSRQQVTQWLQDGAWDEVIGVAQQSTSPDSFLLQSAGYASYQAGDKTNAAQFFDKLLASDSNNRRALYYTALIHKAEDRYTQATQLLERLCRSVPGIAQYHVLLADCYTMQGKKRLAIDELELAHNLSPASAVIVSRLANAFIRAKEWDSGSVVLYPALKQHQKEPVLIASVIKLEYGRKNYDGASRWCDSLIATTRLSYEPLLTGLYADIETKNYRHAVALGEVLIAFGSETEEVLYYTALACQGLKNWRKADTLLRKCVAKLIKPNLEPYYIALADGAEHERDWKACKAYYDTAYYLLRSPATLYLGGTTMEHAGRKADAAQFYRKYLALPVASQDTAIAGYLHRYLTTN